jgi:hypothetical protein
MGAAVKHQWESWREVEWWTFRIFLEFHLLSWETMIWNRIDVELAPRSTIFYASVQHSTGNRFAIRLRTYLHVHIYFSSCWERSIYHTYYSYCSFFSHQLFPRVTAPATAASINPRFNQRTRHCQYVTYYRHRISTHNTVHNSSIYAKATTVV